MQIFQKLLLVQHQLVGDAQLGHKLECTGISAKVDLELALLWG